MESGALTINTAERLSLVEQSRSLGQDLPEIEGGTNIPNARIRRASPEVTCAASRFVNVTGSEEFLLLEQASMIARRSPFLLLIVVFLLSGCSVINPYVRPDDANWKMASPGAGSYAGDLAGAIDYANSWRVTYYKAVGDRALLRNSSALGLLGLGGAALGYGLAAGNNGAVFAGLGAAGATLFGSSSYFQSTPRDRTYLAGSQAIGCALLAVRPLIMTEVDFQDLTADLAQLRASIFNVQTAVDTVRRSADTVRNLGINTPYLSVADTAISDARAALTAANETYKNGQVLHSNVATAGYTLRVTVDNIVATVGDKVTQTEPDLSTLSGIVSGLGQTVSQLHLTAPPPKGQAPASSIALQTAPRLRDLPEVTKLKDDINQLQQLLPDLTSKTEAVAARLDAVGSASFIEDLKNCKVAEVDAGFSVTPSGDTYAIQGGGPSLDFAVQAGNGMPQAALIGPSVPGVILTKDVSSGIFVAHVAAEQTTPGGETQLLLSDSTHQHKKIVTITVDKAPAATTTTATSRTSPQSLSPQTAKPSEWEEREATEAQRKTVQRALNKAGATAADGTTLAEDGVIGLRTREAIGAYQKSKGQLPTYVVTPRLFLELKAIDDANPASPVTSPAVPTSPTPVAGGVVGAETPYEKTLSPNDVSQIQTVLGIPASRRTGTFNDETRTAIMNFTKPQSTPNLTKDIVDRLLLGR